MKQKQCADCRDGEHDNIDDDVRLVYLRDPGTKKIIKRSYMCNNHREMYAEDGYEIGFCNYFNRRTEDEISDPNERK